MSESASSSAVSRELVRLSMGALRSLYRDEIAEAFDVHAVDVGGALAVLTRSLDPDVNRVIALGTAKPATRATLQAVTSLYARANVPFMVLLSPIARPRTLARWLEEEGLRRSDDAVVLARDTRIATVDPAQRVRVERVDRAEADLYGMTHAVAFGLPLTERTLASTPIGQPGWHHYVAYEGPEAVAVAAMYADGRSALFAGSATVRSRRGRGAQSALIARRISDAAELGCARVLAETVAPAGAPPPPAVGNLLRAGFTVAERQAAYVYDRGFRKRLDLATGRWI
ncbi:MAG: hypothetical protein KGK34_00155 [Chloroflexota bacterium]|nr:hypothetical protein [Chloroflexota bacterium]